MEKKTKKTKHHGPRVPRRSGLCCRNKLRAARMVALALGPHTRKLFLRAAKRKAASRRVQVQAPSAVTVTVTAVATIQRVVVVGSGKRGKRERSFSGLSAHGSWGL